MRRFDRPFWVTNWIAAASFVLLLTGITAGDPLLAYVGLGLAGGLPLTILTICGLLRFAHKTPRTGASIRDRGASYTATTDADLPDWSPLTDPFILERLQSIVEDKAPRDFRAMVDSGLWLHLKKIPVLPDLLEEEPLIHGAWRSWRPNSMSALLLILIWFVILANSSLLFGVPESFAHFPPTVLCLMIMLLWPDAFPAKSRAWSHVMPRFTMGTGFLRTRRTGRVIRADQAILYARRMLGPTGIDDRIMVDLVGVPTRRLYFDGPQDPAFVDLWRRWVHPNPRPELSATETAA